MKESARVQAQLLRAESDARARLLGVSERLAARGMPRLGARGKLIRPVVALAGCGGDAPPVGFDAALAAVQLAHEASLVHDDIVDRAAERRGAPSVVASRGVARALVEGDHLLTAAYRMAAETGSLAFAGAFAVAVERTVAGEAQQAAVTGQRIDAVTQRRILAGKSGELFACALSAAAFLRGDAAAEEVAACGRSLGVIYQRVDDLLDYLPAAATGKPALADYRGRHWTWPLDLMDARGFDADPAEVAARLLTPDSSGATPLTRALRCIDDEIAEVRARVRICLGDSPVLDALLERWRSAVHGAAQRSAGTPGVVPAPAPDLPQVAAGSRAWLATLSRGSRSFRFAARFFPAPDRRRIAGVYTFCRHTDDLVDEADNRDAASVERRLDAWAAQARSAYDGHVTGHALLDPVMSDAAAAEVPFEYIAQLIEGVRMDIRPREYPDLDELRRYAHRVAGVVGMWLTELHDVRDAAVLERAATLGHAMQLTNILRDVGEDLDAGRIYVPRTLLTEHGLDRAALVRMRETGRILPGYRSLLEQLMAIADGWYREAFAAILALPLSFQRPVAVAAHVYRGIHEGIRRNGYDNLTGRAYTSLPDKLRLGFCALRDLRRARRRGLFQAPRQRTPMATSADLLVPGQTPGVGVP